MLRSLVKVLAQSAGCKSVQPNRPKRIYTIVIALVKEWRGCNKFKPYVIMGGIFANKRARGLDRIIPCVEGDVC